MPSNNVGALNSDNASNIRPENTRKFVKLLYIIGEGKTEETYFTCVRDAGLLRDDVKLQIIRQKGLDKNDSDRFNMCDIADNLYVRSKFGRVTPHLILSLMLTEYQTFVNTEHELEGVDIVIPTYDELKANRRDIMNDPKLDEFVDENGCLVDQWGFQEFVLDYLWDHYGILFEFENTDAYYPNIDTKVEKEDFCLIFDRDYDPSIFTDDYYEKLMQRGLDGGYTFVVSSPCMELWFLLHFPDLNLPVYYEGGKRVREDLERLIKDNDEFAASGHFNLKHMTEARFRRYYMDTIYLAIDRAKSDDYVQISKIPVELNHNTGTCMGRFMQSIIRDKA